MARVSGIVSAATGAIFLSVVVASAAPESGAKTRFARGVELFDAGKYRNALHDLRAAYALEPRAKILLNIAACLVELREYAEAAQTLSNYLHDPSADAERIPKVGVNVMKVAGGIQHRKRQGDVMDSLAKLSCASIGLNDFRGRPSDGDKKRRRQRC